MMWESHEQLLIPLPTLVKGLPPNLSETLNLPGEILGLTLREKFLIKSIPHLKPCGEGLGFQHPEPSQSCVLQRGLKQLQTSILVLRISSEISHKILKGPDVLIGVLVLTPVERG